ncbi:HAMP domain-containing protein [Paraclostridium bifermentans]
MIIKKLRSLSTFWRMTLISFISIVVIFLITYISQFIVFRVWTIKYEKEEIQSRANELEILLNNNSSDEVQKEILESMNLNAIIYNSDNKELLNTMDEKPKHFNYQKPSSYIIDTSLSVNNDKVSLITPLHIGNQKYYMYLERESELYDDFLENTILIIVFMLIIGLIISLIAGIYISRQFIKKLNNLSNTMKEVQEKGITSRVYIQNPKDEFDKVNIIFNEMMDSVEHSFGVQRQ